ncbi:drug/metabolite transporter (DMT)-like permease [Azospirillum agricola]|uniref:DMT family transporter n=1 Tax=Azospirillum agricola TaxID=1720247 RepID=UPI001F2FF21A|nr:DMT family transporter [Azospirillum agricola]MBP2231500.1 drug/metabolite transporter (DMT)-like permease [Azospirillum agricola]
MASAPRSNPLSIYGLYLVGSALLASNPVLGRALAHVVPPVGLTFWRWALAFLIILPFALPGLLAHRHRLLADWRRFLMLGVLGQGISGAVVYYGLAHTSATNASLIYATSPVMVLAIAAVWLGEAIRPRQAAGILVAMAGVLVILTRGDLDALLHLSFNIGDLQVLAGAISWSVFTILLRQSRGGPLPVMTSFAANALVGVLVLTPFYAWETLAVRPVPFTVHTMLSIGSVALFASVLAFIAYQRTIALMGAAQASTALYLSPLWAALGSWLLLGEGLEPFHLAGVALVLPGVALATLPARPGAPAPEATADRACTDRI